MVGQKQATKNPPIANITHAAGMLETDARPAVDATQATPDAIIILIGLTRTTIPPLANRPRAMKAPYTAIVYTDDPDRLAKDFRLHPARTNANVITAVPYGPIVYERIRTIDGLEHASIAQVPIDCLTGTAGTPSEGEALLKWMRQNEPQRRSSALLGKAGSR